MSIERAKPPVSARKLAVLAAGLGLLTVAGISNSFATANCPQWTTPVCRAWNLGPPPTCREWACAADKKSDPPKLQIGSTNPPKPPSRFDALNTPGLLEQSTALPTTGPAGAGRPGATTPTTTGPVLR